LHIVEVAGFAAPVVGQLVASEQALYHADNQNIVGSPGVHGCTRISHQIHADFLAHADVIALPGELNEAAPIPGVVAKVLFAPALGEPVGFHNRKEGRIGLMVYRGQHVCLLFNGRNAVVILNPIQEGVDRYDLILSQTVVQFPPIHLEEDTAVDMCLDSLTHVFLANGNGGAKGPG
jgi:hypothetical protein